jgi:hypothetical protein
VSWLSNDNSSREATMECATSTQFERDQAALKRIIDEHGSSRALMMVAQALTRLASETSYAGLMTQREQRARDIHRLVQKWDGYAV